MSSNHAIGSDSDRAHDAALALVALRGDSAPEALVGAFRDGEIDLLHDTVVLDRAGGSDADLPDLRHLVEDDIEDMPHMGV